MSSTESIHARGVGCLRALVQIADGAPIRQGRPYGIATALQHGFTMLLI